MIRGDSGSSLQAPLHSGPLVELVELVGTHAKQLDGVDGVTVVGSTDTLQFNGKRILPFALNNKQDSSVLFSRVLHFNPSFMT